MRKRIRVAESSSGSNISILAVIFFIFCTLLGIHFLVQAKRNTLSLEKLEQKKQELERENTRTEQLKRELDTAQSPLEQERIIRDQLLLQKPGEVLLLLPTPVP